jgi:hypothetical protein
MSVAGVVVVAFAIAAFLLVMVELVRTRADPLAYAIALLALAQAVAELSRPS